MRLARVMSTDSFPARRHRRETRSAAISLCALRREGVPASADRRRDTPLQRSLCRGGEPDRQVPRGGARRRRGDAAVAEVSLSRDGRRSVPSPSKPAASVTTRLRIGCPISCGTRCRIARFSTQRRRESFARLRGSSASRARCCRTRARGRRPMSSSASGCASIAC